MRSSVHAAISTSDNGSIRRFYIVVDEPSAVIRLLRRAFPDLEGDDIRLVATFPPIIAESLHLEQDSVTEWHVDEPIRVASLSDTLRQQ
jgi:hypothetical protein